MRKWLGRLTSPFFVPLRRFVVWGDRKFGTCDMKLTIEPRYDDNPLRGFADIDEGTSSTTISELGKKLSKDKANIQGLGESE
jgi:hypothetical protein|tara:strand:+ start:5041 stop:5286 length:246 start_codon:yes stop_codon:yes gene_type:complete